MATASLKTLLKDPTPDLKKINNAVEKLMKRPRAQKTFFQVMTKVWGEDEDSRRILALLNMLKAVSIKPTVFSLCVKETRVAVQNWQYVNSLRLWTEFIARYSHEHELIQSLIHPMVQLLAGVVKMNPGERWIPLRFHCVSMLHTLTGVPTLSEQTATTTTTTNEKQSSALKGRSLSPKHRLLVPSLPFLLDTFQIVDFNRRVSSASRAPIDLRLLLHFSPSMRRETASLDAIVAWLFDLLMEAAAIQATSLAFPEYVLSLSNEVKRMSRTCRIAAFTRQMKAMLVKLNEHSEFVQNRRRRLRSLVNADELARLEAGLAVADDGQTASPFLAYYTLHKQVRAKELQQLTESHKKDVIADESSVRSQGKFQSNFRDMYDKGDDDSDSGASSDASYDLDDGTSTTHVSKSKRKSKKVNGTVEEKKGKGKTSKKASSKDDDEDDDDSSEDSDFDLQDALNESEEDNESDVEILDDEDAEGGDDDQVSEFHLSDSDGEEADLGSDGMNEAAAAESSDDDEKERPKKSLRKAETLKKKKITHTYEKIGKKKVVASKKLPLGASEKGSKKRKQLVSDKRQKSKIDRPAKKQKTQ